MSEEGTFEADDSSFILSGSPGIMQSLDYIDRISNLQWDLDRAVAEINEFKVENARILNEKNAKIESLKNQIKIMENMKNASKRVVISTENNVMYLYKKTSTIIHSDSASRSNKGESSVPKVDSSKANIAKKKTAKKAKKIDVSSIAYNLRSRIIIKSKEMGENKHV